MKHPASRRFFEDSLRASAAAALPLPLVAQNGKSVGPKEWLSGKRGTRAIGRLLIGLLCFVTTAQARLSPPAGFPNPGNTGFIGAGVVEDQLEPITKDRFEITEDGFVLEKKKVTGSIIVKADNVTIKNCWIRGTQGFSIRHEGKNLSIEYCKLDTAGSTNGENVTNYQVENNYTLKHCDLSGFGDGVKAGNDTIIEHNFIHDLKTDPEYHGDCIQVMAGKNIQIRNNTLMARWKMQTSAIILKADKGPITDVVIESNFMSGGAFVFYNVGGTAIKFKNNTIEKGSWQWNGGPAYPKNSPVEYDGNRFHDGTLIPENPEAKDGQATVKITPVPWNGSAAAVTLTFDDGYEDQLDNAIPELDSRGMKGTFYLVNNNWYQKRNTDWAKAAASGHEIGNHSRDHLDPDTKPDRSREEWESDIIGWKAALEADLKTQVTSYAHPFCHSPDYTMAVVGEGHFIARECGGNFLISFDKEPADWLRIEGRSTTGISQETIIHEVSNALNQGKWVTYYFHSIAGPWGGFPMNDFTGSLDFLKSKDIWVDTHSRIGGYLKASFILAGAEVQEAENGQIIQWEIPGSFPGNVIIKVTLSDLDGKKPFQNDKEITPNDKGQYPINFDAGEMRFKLNR